MEKQFNIHIFNGTCNYYKFSSTYEERVTTVTKQKIHMDNGKTVIGGGAQSFVSRFFLDGTVV